MEKHQYKNTETYDLWQAWETASKNVPIKAILQSWTEQMGYPLLTVKSVTDKSGKRHISVDQRWYLADGQKLEPANLWQIPMFVTTSSGTKPLELMTSKERTYEIDSGKFFKLNGGQDILMRVNYPRSVWLDLIAAVKEGNLGIQDRTGLLNDAYALAKSGDLEADVLLMLIQGYENEDTYPVWSALGGSLSGLHKILTEDDLQREQLENLGKRLVLKLFNRVGWKSTESDGHLGKLLRALCIGLLETFCADDAVILGECRSLFKSYIEAVQKSEFEEASRVLPSEYRQSVFRVVLKAAEGREELDMLLDSLKKIESIAERKPIYLSLGFVKREDLKKEVLEWAVAGPSEGHVKLQDFFYVIASVSFSGVVGLRITWEYLKENFDEKYVPMLSAASPSLLAAVVMYSGSGFTTEDKAQEIKDFFAQNNRTNKIQRKVEQMVEATNNNAQFRLKLLKNTKFTEYLATV